MHLPTQSSGLCSLTRAHLSPRNLVYPSYRPLLVISLLLRLPPGVLVSFRMVDMDAADGGEEDEADKELTGLEGRAHTKASAKASSSSSAAAATAAAAVAEAEDSSGRTARGLCVGLTWMQPGGQALQVCQRDPIESLYLLPPNPQTPTLFVLLTLVWGP